ncbi:MAG: NUDIX domain-containing protein [Myxococcales bacterium]|nr:NUDIX domain-containing protein [Myxococcales bacterium]
MREASFGVIPYYVDGYRYLYLLVQHHGGHWGFPKGHPNEGESAIQTARREFEEETGVREYQVNPERSFMEVYVFQKGRTEVEKTVTYYPARVFSPEVHLQAEEIKDHRWLTFEDGIKLITFDGSKQVLAEVRNFIEQF